MRSSNFRVVLGWRSRSESGTGKKKREVRQGKLSGFVSEQRSNGEERLTH